MRLTAFIERFATTSVEGRGVCFFHLKAAAIPQVRNDVAFCIWKINNASQVVMPKENCHFQITSEGPATAAHFHMHSPSPSRASGARQRRVADDVSAIYS